MEKIACIFNATEIAIIFIFNNLNVIKQVSIYIKTWLLNIAKRVCIYYLTNYNKELNAYHVKLCFFLQCFY